MRQMCFRLLFEYAVLSVFDVSSRSPTTNKHRAGVPPGEQIIKTLKHPADSEINIEIPKKKKEEK